MRRIGLVGGVTWHSTATYYRALNEGVAARVGPYRSADIALRSLDYGLVRRCREQRDHRPLRTAVADAAAEVVHAGAEAIALCSNSLHGALPAVRARVDVPILHIADALADAALDAGHRHLALFGTGFTMRAPFLRDRLAARGLHIAVPADIDAIDRIIVEDLARGHLDDDARARFLHELEPLVSAGATAFVAACTEIPALIRPADLPVPMLDTLALHVDAILDWMVAG
jgi:aspartate racemase